MQANEFQEIARSVILVLLVGSAVVTKKIINIIGNEKLSSSINKFFTVLVVIILLRIAATWLDFMLNLTMDIVSTIVGVGSYVYLFYVLFKFYMSLKRRDEDLHRTEGSILYVPPLNKEKIKTHIDGLFTELSYAKKKTTDLQHDIEETLKKYE